MIRHLTIAWGHVSVLAAALLTAQPADRNVPVGTILQGLRGNDALREVSVSVSGDGQFVAFESRAALVLEDSNNAVDIYLLTRHTSEITLVSRAVAGLAANGNSACPRISADGRFVTFQSAASRLVPGDTNERVDVFLWDRMTGALERISVSNLGDEGNGSSLRPAISSDGRVVAFQSTATNLVEGDDANGDVADVYVYRTDRKQVSRVSVADDGRQGTRGSHFDVAISGDGQAIVFTSTGDLGCPGSRRDTRRPGESASTDVYVKHLESGQIACVSHAADGRAANGRSYHAAIDESGSRVAYVTEATNLGLRDRSGASDVVLRDVRSGTIEMISRAANGGSANGPSWQPALSSNGRYVGFVSTASDLICRRRCSSPELDVNLIADVYLFDSESALMRRLSTGGGVEWWAASRGPALDRGASIVAFSSSQPVSTTDISGDEDLFILSLAKPLNP